MTNSGTRGRGCPTDGPLPPLFDFTEAELRGCTPEMVAKLVPPHAQAGGSSEGVARWREGTDAA